MKNVTIIISAAAILLTLTTTAFSCAGRLEHLSESGSSEYDPFSPNEFRRNYGVTVRNTGMERCSYAVAFVRTPTGAKLGNLLPYSLEDNNGHNLLSNVADASNAALPSGVVPTGTAVTLSAYVTVSRGSFAVPGVYRDELDVVLFGWNEARERQVVALDQQKATIERHVFPRFSVVIAGGNLQSTIEFGELARGIERSVMLQTSSNQTYQLEVSSSNSGHLVIDPMVPGQTWKVGYTLHIDDEVVSLDKTSRILQLGISKNGEHSHKLTFRMNDPAKLRAGHYRDVVTVRIGAKT
jgi:hypothetical protein